MWRGEYGWGRLRRLRRSARAVLSLGGGDERDTVVGGSYSALGQPSVGIGRLLPAYGHDRLGILLSGVLPSVVGPASYTSGYIPRGPPHRRLAALRRGRPPLGPARPS